MITSQVVACNAEPGTIGLVVGVSTTGGVAGVVGAGGGGVVGGVGTDPHAARKTSAVRVIQWGIM